MINGESLVNGKSSPPLLEVMARQTSIVAHKRRPKRFIVNMVTVFSFLSAVNVQNEGKGTFDEGVCFFDKVSNPP